MASSTKKKTKPHQKSSITDFFSSFTETARSELPTSDGKPHKLKRLKNTGGLAKPRERHTVAAVTTASSGGSGDVVHTTSTVEYIIECDACPPVTKEPSSRNEQKNPWKCHPQSSSVDLPKLSSHAAPEDKKCSGSIYSERHSTVKRMPHLSQTLGWTKTTQPVDVETIDITPLCNHSQGKNAQHHLPLRSGKKSTQKSCDQDLSSSHKEQAGKTQTPQRTHLSKKAERPDTQDIGSVEQLPAHCALQPGGHVLQKPQDHLLWGLPWPTSVLLRNLRRSGNPLWSSGVQQRPTGWQSFTTQSFPPVDRQRSSGWRRDLLEDILKQLIEEIKVTNPVFPVQKFFAVLSKKRSEHEKTLADQVSEGVHCLRGKRKWRREGLSPCLSPKRQRTNHRPEEKAAAGSGPSAQISQDILGHTPRRLVCRSRLSRTRRRKQQQERESPSVASSVTLNQWDTAGKNTEDITRQFHGQEIQREEGVLWTEKYQPQHSTEVVGNPAGVKKLHSWLKEWKLKADKEECRRKKEKIQKKKSEGSWDSGDFVGEVVLEDCEVELGNALLITGPHGVGKTAAVYACAQELGFKVFEVNASSQRSGRLLLAQLKEATQSHQVGTPTASTMKPTYFTSHNTAGCSAKLPSSTQKANSSRKVMTSARRQPSILRKSSLRRGRSTSVDLTHFFQTTHKPDNTKHSCPNRVQHDVVHTEEPNTEKSEAQCITIIMDDEDNHSMTKAGKSTLMSLILFEEVDVIFSEDVGFLSAIKTFMSTSKRPVVLTTTDPWFGGTFDGRLEELHFKKPPVRVVCSYLQLVCLVENVRTDLLDVSSLPATQTGDIRQCLLQLQFWVRSGGGPAAPLLLNHSVMPQCLSCGRASSHIHEESVERWRKPADLPPCETGCSGTLQAFLAVHELARMFKVLTWTTSENRRCAEILSESQQSGVDLLYLNMEALLPLPTTTSPNPTDYLKEVSNSGLYRDTQAKKLPELSPVVDKPLGGRPSSKPRKGRCLSLKRLQRSKPNSPEKTEISSCHPQSEGSAERHSGERTSSLVSSCLDSLTGFLDNLSFLDCCLQDGHVRRTGHCTPDLLCVRTRAELRDGMLDELRDEEQEVEQVWRHKAPDIRAAVEGMSFRRCWVEMEQAMARARRLGEEVGGDQCKQVLEQLTLPPPPHTHNLLSGQPSYTEINVAERRADLIKTVLSSKALSRLGSSPAAITDYLPCLRTICKLERLQDKDKTRHSRFHHYLKSIQSGLSKGTLQLLSADFP